MALAWRIDWTAAGQFIIETSTVDASVTLATGDPNPFWFMIVAGAPAYIAEGTAATSAAAFCPIGRDDQPKLIPGGTVMHAITAFGAGTVSFVRAHPVDLAD